MFIAKLGHQYRKDGFYGMNYQNRHVADRWQKPGDEATKNIPNSGVEVRNIGISLIPIS